ncbi:MAG: ABC transporter substrate-binding protein, partial [Gaiellaceae bacterium]
MTLRNRWARWTSIAVLVAAVSLLAAACGGGGSKNSEGTTTSTTSSGGSSQQKTFANFRVVYDTGTDYLDPAYSYTVEGWEIMWNVYLGLLGYKHVNGPDGATIVPALAKDLPQVSSDGKTYTLTLRSGLKYSDGTPVKASDFTHEIKRLLFLGGPFSSFFGGIVGADAYTKAKKEDAPLPGIVANDSTGQIKVTLTAADSTFPYAVAEPAAAPTPAAKSPFKDLTAKPPPGVGSYTMQIINPSREYILTKNPSFNIPGMAKGNVDKIDAKVSNDVNQMTENIIN